MKLSSNFIVLSFMLILTVILLIPSGVLANDMIAVTINGEEVVFEGQPPIILDGITLVPVRGVFESLGFEVEWNDETRTVKLSNGSVIVITIGSSIFIANDISQNLAVPAQIIDGRTLLPIGAVLESIGYEWNEDTRTVTTAINIGTSATMRPFNSDFTYSIRVNLNDGTQRTNTREFDPHHELTFEDLFMIIGENDEVIFDEDRAYRLGMELYAWTLLRQVVPSNNRENAYNQVGYSLEAGRTIYDLWHDPDTHNFWIREPDGNYVFTVFAFWVRLE